jgi:hypothetical protein
MCEEPPRSKDATRGQGLIRGRSVSMERRSEDEDASSDSERLPDSLDDQGIPDSGVGSSSEKTSTVCNIMSNLFLSLSLSPSPVLNLAVFFPLFLPFLFSLLVLFLLYLFVSLSL